jgi:hypothetical protein
MKIAHGTDNLEHYKNQRFANYLNPFKNCAFALDKEIKEE